MSNNRAQQRLRALFAELDRLAADPRGDSAEIKREIESMRARLLELEELILRDEHTGDTEPDQVSIASPLTIQTGPAHFQVYEKDKVAFAYSNDSLEQLPDASKVLSEVHKVITSPLTAGGQVIGKVQVAPPTDRKLTADEMRLTHAITQQASVQIQNLRLLSEAERSRLEAESATRRFIHEGWDSYLDAVQRSERIGFTYDQSALSPYSDVLHINGGMHAPVKVMEEPVGALYIEPDPTRKWSDAQKQLVSAVADQIAQQVENIRLLADASRARADAEQAIRHLTRENWGEFTAERDGSELGFVYDTLQVKPIQHTNVPEDINLSGPLVISGETIGQLAVAGLKKVPAEAASMLTSIAAQASIHLETLRLTDELKKRARELKELDRLKSAFLANMSHELRTPLNSILGFTDVMLEGLDGPLTDYMNNDLRLIQKNGQHLLHLINDVLDMAKIESGRMNLHPEKFTVHSVLDEVTNITSTLASEKNIALFIEEGSDQEVEIYADNTRIRQVMINLVNNAIKFTLNGKISMRVSRPDGATALITVKDTGIGIPPDKLEAVFQEFTQVDTSTTRKVGGTGLGLPISRRLVEMHGGRLWAESTGIEGEGSTFYVELPLEARITDIVEKKEK
ncbi:MAG TPA: ATP-binding protein [Anaerolineales bacterium]|nr:ATP-binding protein [Anaerolineales bacterium]